MLYSDTGRVHPSPPRCVSLLNTEDSTQQIFAPAAAGLVPSKYLKLLLAAGQRRLLAEELCRTTVTLQNFFKFLFFEISKIFFSFSEISKSFLSLLEIFKVKLCSL